jgi:hypothetical protein
MESHGGRQPLKRKMRRRFFPFYGVLLALIAASFLWQMLHGVCPVP